MLALRRSASLALLAVSLAYLPSPAAAAEPKYLPGNTQIVFTINVRQILDSEVVKGQKDVINQIKAALENKLPGDNRAKDFLDKMGFDVMKDLTSVVVAHPGTKDAEDVTVVLVGKFNPKKVEAVAKEAAESNGDALQIATIGNNKVYEITPPGQKAFSATLLGTEAMVITPNRDSLKEILARDSGLKKPTLKRELIGLLKATSDKQSLSFVATGEALVTLSENANVPNAQAVGPVLQTLEGITGALTMAKDIRFQLGIGSRDAETAKKLQAGGQAGIQFIKLMVAQKAMEDEKLAPLVEVVNTLKVTLEGTNTMLTGEISYANLDKLIKSFNRLPQQ